VPKGELSWKDRYILPFGEWRSKIFYDAKSLVKALKLDKNLSHNTGNIIL
jgi:hypothetical protein